MKRPVNCPQSPVRRGRIKKHKECLQAQNQALDLHPIFNPPLDHFHASLANEVLGDCQPGLNGVRGVRLSLIEALVVWVNGGVTLCNPLRVGFGLLFWAFNKIRDL
ncbi:hypothetical protein Tco_0827210 [Tanacetum coccineum]